MHFNLLDEKWIPVLRVDGNVEPVSLRQLFEDAHQLSRLSEACPLIEVGLLRFLIALFSDGLRKRVSTEQDWAPFAEMCRSGLSPEVVEAILEPLARGSDALFDGPEFERLQDLGLATSCERPASQVMLGMPTDTNLAHFHHVYDGDCVLCLGCLAKGMLSEGAFGAYGGRAGISGEYKKGTFSEGKPLVIPVGRSLLTTLLANMVIGDVSRPAWVRIYDEPDRNPGAMAILSWHPRLVCPSVPRKDSASCRRCMAGDQEVFACVKYGDTYTHANSRFGSPEILDAWRAAGGDPHVIPAAEGRIAVGGRPEEWPLRAIIRLLTSDTATVLDRLPEREALVGPIAISVTSSGGNQAKIDDAPHAAISLAPGLLARSLEVRTRIAAALGTIFDESHAAQRRTLIPHAVPQLLSELAVTDEPATAVAAWLESANTHAPLRSNDPTLAESMDNDPLLESARRLVYRLSRISQGELAALRGTRRRSITTAAERQRAFEAVWHGVSLPSGLRRHALREALATVAAVYATYPGLHRWSRTRGSFEKQLRERITAEQAAGSKQREQGSVRSLVAKLIMASPAARDDLLMRLVDAVVTGAPSRRRCSVDFGDLLHAIACWADPVAPTPARWRRLLETGSVESVG